MAASGLPILQINLHHCKSASAIMQRNMAAMHTGIALIQEPWVVKGTIRGLGSGGVCFRDPGSQRPRACLLVKGVTAVPLYDFCTGDLMAASMKMEGVGRLVIASAYLPFDSMDNPTEEVRKLVEFYSHNELSLVLGCDANSHHSVWGSTDTNARGIKLLEYLAGTELEILNVGDTPTFRSGTREEVIDITLCSNQIMNKIRNWRVEEEDTLSDHSLITFKLGTHEV